MTSVFSTPELQSAVQSIISGSTGSGTDVAAVVNALVSAKVAGQSSIIGVKQGQANNQMSAVGTLKSALTALQDAVKGLTNGKALSSFAAKLDGKGVAASADKSAVAGSYAITVDNIATSQSISSGAFDAKATLGVGTLKITVGNREISVDINSSNNTLSGVAAAINRASGGTGVAATIVNGVDGAHLVMRSTETGVNNAISMEVSLKEGTVDEGLSRLNVTSTTGTLDPDDPTSTVSTTVDAVSGWKQSVAGQDASLLVAGTRVTSGSNRVENAIAGITLSLGQESAGTTQTLSIQPDTDGQKVAITNFVDAYNKFVGTVSTLNAFDAAAPIGAQGGALMGDSMLNAIRNNLAGIMSQGVVAGNAKVNLGAIGISLQADGKLKIDDESLKLAISSRPDQIQALFNSSTGVAASISSGIDSYVKQGGVIDNRLQAITKDTESLTEQKKRLAAYADELTNKYNAQFSALNSLMTRMNSSSSYLTQLFGNANNSGALNAR